MGGKKKREIIEKEGGTVMGQKAGHGRGDRSNDRKSRRKSGAAAVCMQCFYM